jgi:predicted enzyme related to lactoylglutathione lyase
MNDRMITGAHSFIYSTDADADRAFLRDVLAFPHVDAGGGWLIFALPASELAVHPSDRNDHHELYLMCDDIDTFVAAMNARGVVCEPLAEQGWGTLTRLTLPGGGRIGVYEPRHTRPAVPKSTRNRAAAKRGKPKTRAARRRSAKRPRARGR